MQKELLDWYRENKRDLPWRKNKDPYRIWISEVMLQQTTIAAVIPYYEKFLKRFPSVQKLAAAPESEVLEMWAGLGYYSRARNLHKSSQIIAAQGFPQSFQELLKLPGFGPYTSRAVASLAFDEPTGVLDGNVIRVLSRVYGLKSNWWLPRERLRLQKLSDKLANTEFNSEINQGMMELGATICTPQKPLCLLCPWKKSCLALKKNAVSRLPLPKPKQKTEIWNWKMSVYTQKNKIYLEPSTATPFLTNLQFPPGKALQVTQKPKKFDIKHSVTKYQIYLQLDITSVKNLRLKPSPKNWFHLSEIKKINPSSLMTKILKNIEAKDNI